MSSPSRVLEFFILEATEYVDRLDETFSHAATDAPDPDAVGGAARALRGSATMAHQRGIADLALAIERVARALHSGSERWDVALRSALVAAVDELRTLVRSVQAPPPDAELRARARAAELARWAPAAEDTADSGRDTSGYEFLSAELTDLARRLERCAEPSPDPEELTGAAERVRSLRGIAELRDAPAVAEVLEALDGAVRAPDSAGAAAPRRGVYQAAAAVLRHAARDFGAGRRPPADVAELTEFRRGRAALGGDGAPQVRIVPIAQLFHDDSGPHVLQTAPNPRTTVEERFRLEVVSLAEHVRAVVDDARAHPGAEHAARLAADMRAALRALGSTAHSFGQKDVARWAAAWSVRTAELDPPALTTIDGAAAVLADPTTTGSGLTHALARFAAPRTVPPTPHATPAVSAAAQPRPASRTPTGVDLHALLQQGIAGLRPLEDRPLSPPAALPDGDIVPIEQLLYRGRRALERAAEVRADILQSGADASREHVLELCDLVGLALTE